MDISGYVVSGSGSGPAGYALDGYTVVQRGRQREVLRTLGIFLVLLAAQWPMRQSAMGTWESEGDLPVVVPGRLSLIVDVAMIFAYLLLAYRSFGLLRSTRPPMSLLRINQVGVGLVVLGGVMDIREDWKLWQLLAEREPGKRSLTLTWDDALGFDPGPGTFSEVMFWTVVAGLLLVGTTVVMGITGIWEMRFGMIYRLGLERASDRYVAPRDVSCQDTGGDVICCSGGGIRSAAFSLGGLEALSEAGIYSTARAVCGVSGGGYTGAAYHVARWNPADDEAAGSEWPGEKAPGKTPPYGLASPETGWLRRHTRYVLGSVKVALQAVLSLGFGVAVNLLLLAALLGGLAWVLGWLMVASGRLPGKGSFGEDWYLVSNVWWLPVAGVVVFVARKVLDRWWIPPTWLRNQFERATAMLILGGGAATVLLLGVPWVLETLNTFAAKDHGPWDDLVTALGLATRDAAADTGSAVKASGATIATVISAILAVLASVKSAGKEASSPESGLGKLWGKVWAKIKDPVVPWLAAIAVLVVLVVVLLRWVAGLVADPELLQKWGLAYVFGGLLLAAKLGTDANRTSLHHFFRERISGAFLVRKAGGSVKPIPYRRPLRFSESAPLDGGPELVACAVANVSDEDIVPSRRGCVPFVFDHEAIGLTDRLLPAGAGQRSSTTYEFAADPWYRDATVPAALAMSAAAFSPLAGRENVRLGPYRAVLALGNARLGVWLPNPLWVDEVGLFKRLRRFGRNVEAAELLVRLKDAAGKRPKHPKVSDEGWDKWEALAASNQALRERRTSLEEAAERVALFRRELGRTPAPGSPEEKVLERLQDLVNVARGEVDAAAAVVKAKEEPLESGSTLGWWLVESVRLVFKKPGLTRLTKEAVGKASIYDRFLYVTDGGHYDNLGLIEALRRRPKRIFVLDASNDKEDTFRTLGRAIATARMDLDCNVRMDPRGMKKLEKKPAEAAWCLGTYEFASSGEKGQIFLCKAVMLDGLPWDIQTYADDNVDFPRTSTSNQLYSEFDFEGYRALGQTVVTKLLESPEYVAARAAAP